METICDETSVRKRRLSSFHLAERIASSTKKRTPSRLSQGPGDGPRRMSVGVARTPHGAARTPRTSHTPRTPRTPHSNRAAQKLSAEEIAALYSNTIRLCQDNKINSKNSWSLNLIDYMGMLVRSEDAADPASSASKTSSSDTNFQLAGVTLDAGVRIYCSRVDSVHTNAFKVLTGLSRTAGGGDSQGLDDTLDEDGEPSASEATGKKRRRRGGVTLVNNMATITVHKMETDLAVDPLFQKMSAAYDEGGAKGMLLNNLLTESSGYILLDSDEVADSSGPANDSVEDEATYDVEEEFPNFQFQTNETLCYRFVSFFNSRRGPLDDVTSETVSFASEEVPSSNCTFEYEQGDIGESTLGVFSQASTFQNTQDSFGNEDDHDPDDFQAPTFGGQDDFGQGRHSLDSNASVANAALRGNFDLVEAGVALQTDSEYSFFDSTALSSWAGPQHWKFHTASSSSSKAQKASKRPRSKAAMLLDFSSDAPKIDFAAEFKASKTATATMLTNAVLDGFSEKKVTLPDDLHYGVRDLTKLYLMPNVRVALDGTQKSVLTVQEDNSGQHAWYDYDNDCDNENFCADTMESLAPDTDVTSISSAVNGLSGMNLIEEPKMVDKIDISYAKVAKKVDVRKLKSGMWSHLCGGAEDATLEEDVVDSNVEKSVEDVDKESEKIVNVEKDIRAGKTQTLRELVKELPTFVPGPALTDVSLPYVFICLLHLANEKTLSISSIEDSLNDLVITRDPDE